MKKAERAVIGDEICLDVKDVKKYFPIYKGMMRKHIGDVKAIEDISFRAPELTDKDVVIDADYVNERLADIVINRDLSQFIL